MSLQPAPKRADEVDEFDDDLSEPAADTGELDPGTRRVLLRLLRGPYLTAEDHTKLWGALVRNEQLVRSRLADLYLELVVDLASGVAFVRNLAVEDAPKVVRSHPLTVLDTVLVLFLRRTLLAGQGSSARTFVGRDEIEDQLRGFQALDSTNKKGFDDRIQAAIRKMENNSVLLSVTGTDDRWEISPVLALVFGADEVAAVTADLERLAGP
ncbi:hypothetical protein GCM10025789_02810 [Tessaracoccus lubricantis]|uniref:DUF4194 domain-containing protein n=1 Tax=Tessaracoccus lubricantis TaxID=545543 RepID=A0ABP9EYD1_9ACTN